MAAIMKSATLAFLVLLGACDPDRSSTAPAAKPATPAVSRSITVFAASSLKELVTEIAAGWERRTGRQVRLQFEASSRLGRQAREGAPADLFITAAPEWLDEIEVVERYDWLSNRLVCVVRKDVTDFDLKTADSLALANEQVPAGKYAKAALAHLGIALPERILHGSNARDVLSKVSQGGATAGIVYATDAAVDPAVRIAYSFPAESHPRILYSVGVLTRNGADFAAALRDAAAFEAAVRRGFVELE